MSDRPFLDTCIFVYTLVDGEPRQKRAIEIVDGGGKVSIQVLNEFANVCRRKMHMSWDEIVGALQSVRYFCPNPIPITLSVHEKALGIGRRHGFSVYDCLMIAAAAEAQCTTLYTEDLQHGQIVEGLRVVNPFRSASQIN